MSIKISLRELIRSSGLGSLIHDHYSMFLKDLNGHSSILDVGCGVDSLVRDNDVYSVGCDIHAPYLLESRDLKQHDGYVQCDLNENLPFKDNSFDLALCADVVEHLEKEKGFNLLAELERVARKKVVVITPNGFIEQNIYDENAYQ